jgi:hypothetical protein
MLLSILDTMGRDKLSMPVKSRNRHFEVREG